MLQPAHPCVQKKLRCLNSRERATGVYGFAGLTLYLFCGFEGVDVVAKCWTKAKKVSLCAKLAAAMEGRELPVCQFNSTQMHPVRRRPV
jgi:hypothetical protein